MSIVIKNLKKGFGNFSAINDVSLQVQEGEFVALLGPSGSGKTTLLRIIAGLEWPDEGEIYLEGVDAAGKPTRERKIGFVFQHFALFKHMSVFENIAFGLRLKRPKLTEEDIQARVDRLLALVHLSGSGGKYPSELSGGQRQRVALARVLAIEPKYMLLDEPFGALDSKVRKELRRWLRKLHDATGLTTIFVTHDQEEAMEVADRIGILNKGSLVQLGTPLEIWENPVNSFVFDFIGNYNTFTGFEDDEKKLVINYRAPFSPTGKIIKAFSRPHELTLERHPQEIQYYLPAKVVLVNLAGPFVKLELEGIDNTFYQVDMEKAAFEAMKINIGERLWVKPAYYRSFDE